MKRSALKKSTVRRRSVVDCAQCGQSMSSANMARHLERHSRPRSSSTPSLLCRSVRKEQQSRSESLGDNQSVLSLDSHQDEDLDDDGEEGEERFAGLSFSTYSAACTASVAVLRHTHQSYDVVSLTEYLSKNCPKIPEESRPFLAIGAAYGAMHAVHLSGFADKHQASTDPAKIAMSRETRCGLAAWSLGLAVREQLGPSGSSAYRAMTTAPVARVEDPTAHVSTFSNTTMTGMMINQTSAVQPTSSASTSAGPKVATCSGICLDQFDFPVNRGRSDLSCRDVVGPAAREAGRRVPADTPIPVGLDVETAPSSTHHDRPVEVPIVCNQSSNVADDSDPAGSSVTDVRSAVQGAAQEGRVAHEAVKTVPEQAVSGTRKYRASETLIRKQKAGIVTSKYRAKKLQGSGDGTMPILDLDLLDLPVDRMQSNNSCSDMLKQAMNASGIPTTEVTQHGLEGVTILVPTEDFHCTPAGAMNEATAPNDIEATVQNKDEAPQQSSTVNASGMSMPYIIITGNEREVADVCLERYEVECGTSGENEVVEQEYPAVEKALAVKKGMQRKKMKITSDNENQVWYEEVEPSEDERPLVIVVDEMEFDSENNEQVSSPVVPSCSNVVTPEFKKSDSSHVSKKSNRVKERRTETNKESNAKEKTIKEKLAVAIEVEREEKETPKEKSTGSKKKLEKKSNRAEEKPDESKKESRRSHQKLSAMEKQSTELKNSEKSNEVLVEPDRTEVVELERESNRSKAEITEGRKEVKKPAETKEQSSEEICVKQQPKVALSSKRSEKLEETPSSKETDHESKKRDRVLGCAKSAETALKQPRAAEEGQGENLHRVSSVISIIPLSTGWIAHPDKPDSDGYRGEDSRQSLEHESSHRHKRGSGDHHSQGSSHRSRRSSRTRSRSPAHRQLSQQESGRCQVNLNSAEMAVLQQYREREEHYNRQREEQYNREREEHFNREREERYNCGRRRQFHPWQRGRYARR